MVGFVAASMALAETGLPVPRFVSLGESEVNVRAGPGFRYPVSWVFVRDGMPVEVIEEFEHWRRVRDMDGSEGWVHHSMLSGRRHVIITGTTQTLRDAPADQAMPVARAEVGVQGSLLRCEGVWCEVRVAGHEGWVPQANLWGVYHDEVVE